MSATTAAAVKAPDTFAILSTELSKAGYGYTKASKDAIESTAQRGFALTKSATTVTPDEVDFYRALRAKVSATTDTTEAIVDDLKAIASEKPVISLQQNAPKFRTNFLTQNEKQRFEFLNSADFRLAHATATDTAKRLVPLADRTMRLLYTVNGSKETPFKDQNSFIAHRNNIIGVLNKAVDFQNHIAALGNSLSADALYQSVEDQRNNTRLARTKRAISNHPYLIASLPVTATLAAAGYAAYRHFGV